MPRGYAGLAALELSFLIGPHPRPPLVDLGDGLDAGAMPESPCRVPSSVSVPGRQSLAIPGGPTVPDSGAWPSNHQPHPTPPFPAPSMNGSYRAPLAPDKTGGSPLPAGPSPKSLPSHQAPGLGPQAIAADTASTQ